MTAVDRFLGAMTHIGPQGFVSGTIFAAIRKNHLPAGQGLCNKQFDKIDNGDYQMKTVCKFATLALVVCLVSAHGFSQSNSNKVSGKPATTTQNLIRGVIGPAGNNSSWSNYSVFGLIPGSGLFPITSSTTVFYFGFTGGTEADIGNMVVYTTARGSLTITATTPVTLGGVSNPSIALSNTSVCPVAPSSTAPCIVRFDPTTLTLTPSSDYYFVVYYTNDTNNSGISGTQPGNNNQTSLAGAYFGGTDYTHLTVGESLPGTANRSPSFLMYVMTN
jgi:hypothetical protein